MSEMLSNSKRKYIESWRQSVCEHMESGTICRITISEMTPEPSGYISYIKPSIEHVKAMVSNYNDLVLWIIEFLVPKPVSISYNFKLTTSY